jgi:subtilisin
MLVIALLLVTGLPSLAGAVGVQAQEAQARQSVIVALPRAVGLDRVLRENDIRPRFRYSRALNGFAAELPQAKVEALQRIPGVIVTPDLLVEAIGQEVEADGDRVGTSRKRRSSQKLPTGVNRIDADMNVAADIGRDGTTAAMAGVGIAILDTGIFRHKDLNVQTGKVCIGNTGTNDKDGHGTHVAGTAAAKDNRIGVVGVAPGAPLYPVKVLDDNGKGDYSTIICGLDWVLANTDKVDVVNMSIGADDPDPTTCANDAFHRAVCSVVQAGIPVVVAAGNEQLPADTSAPAKFDEAITVSAFADSNGKPGGGGGQTCFGNGDDTFSITYSNYDSDVDIAAPGDCIRSTFPGDVYRNLTGTSMASPHVAGAAALYLSQNPNASPAQVENYLLNEWSVPQTDRKGFRLDPDGQLEPASYIGPDEPA